MALLLALAAAPGCPHPPDTSSMATQPRTCEVFDGTDLILTVSDVPGPITSTAPPPPGGRVVSHPFLSGAAQSAFHEGRLRELLDASTSFEDYLVKLRAAGFTVVEKPAR